MPADIRNPTVLYAKAFLFVVIVATASTLIVIGQPRAVTIFLLALVIWASARAYYFAFYVLQRYVDPSLRYSGMGSMVAHLLRAPRA